MCKFIFSFLKRHLLLCGGRILSNDAKSLEDLDHDREAPLLEEQERGRLLKVVAAPALYPQSHHCIERLTTDNGTDDTREDLVDPTSIPAMNNEDRGLLNNTSLGTEEINEVFEVRSLGPYNNTQKILLVGEGDFSFSASLAIAFGSSASNMIATSLDSCEFLMENYERVEGHLYELALRGCGVLHNFDATKMARSFLGSRSFDRIVFNFPHAGFPRRRKSREDQIRRNQELVKGFLANAKEMIKEDGEIHITHKCNGFHLEWRIVKMARSQGLRLLQQVPFRVEDYPGYETKYGFGGDKNFDCNPSKTYKFVLRERLKELQSKGIKQ